MRARIVGSLLLSLICGCSSFLPERADSQTYRYYRILTETGGKVQAEKYIIFDKNGNRVFEKEIIYHEKNVIIPIPVMPGYEFPGRQRNSKHDKRLEV